MVIKKKPRKKSQSGKAPIIDKSRMELKKLVAEIAEEKYSYKDIADEVYKRTSVPITQPTVGKYLEEEWGKDFSKKKAKMSERRSVFKKWNKEFKEVRFHINEIFHRDYISEYDGMLFNKEKYTLESIPVEMSRWQRRRLRGRIITFVFEEEFSILDSIKKQLKPKIMKLAKEEYARLKKKTFEDKMGSKNSSGMNLEEIKELQKKVRKEIKLDLESKRIKINKKAEKRFERMISDLQKDGVDNRNAALFGKNLINRSFCPAYRDGKGRMLVME